MNSLTESDWTYVTVIALEVYRERRSGDPRLGVNATTLSGLSNPQSPEQAQNDLWADCVRQAWIIHRRTRNLPVEAP